MERFFRSGFWFFLFRSDHEFHNISYFYLKKNRTSSLSAVVDPMTDVCLPFILPHSRRSMFLSNAISRTSAVLFFAFSFLI